MRDKFKAAKYTDKEIQWVLDNGTREDTWKDLATEFNKKFKKTKTGNALRKMYNSYEEFADEGIEEEVIERVQPKVLVFDIETAPILGYVWRLWDQNVGLNQIHSDWYVLSWSAKWLGTPEDEVMYEDQRNAKVIEDDSKILATIWNLLDEADIVITQNGKKFDVKKLNARFILNGFQPPTPYRHIDTLVLARRHFGFTSNKLEYMTDKLCTKYKKLKHAKFSGFELWKECLAGNLEAWDEMEVYNRYDVLSLEELYNKLIPWDNSIDFNAYHDSLETECSCGNTEYVKAGFHTTNLGRYQMYKCTSCGKVHRDGVNLLSKEKRQTTRRKAIR
jgi:uncharacterized protein YprB with RNaseH-like and TPR domain